ncbi:ATP-binding protein [Dyella monticola]|uniref:ATP-binding protein n=1 Tax=Dyella monticola TaxID=1927958 RepID=A0A370X5G2_9GAMM|nr:ATP-binding protein [Dyella monticola]RDS83606.1 ATP-binding protein [Dyella monticola]
MNAVAAFPMPHPLEQLFRPTVATNPIERLADAINSALDVGYRGLGIFGFARFGKSEAVQYLMHHPEWMGDRRAAFFRMDAPDGHKRSDTTFFKMCMALLGVRIPARATQVELGAMVAGRLIEICQNAGTRLIVLFIDEAQRLVPTDYENLVSLDNRMTQAGYYLFIAFVHQRDITGFTNETIASNDHPPHVVGRFLIRKHEFTGLCDTEEAAYVLSRYDEGTEWPPGSAISFTQHYACQAFANGFRMSQYATRLWAMASNLRTEARLPPNWTWPMKTFEATVVYLLTVIVPRTPSFESFTDQDLAEALHASGLVELELSRHTYKPKGDQ